MCVCGGNEADEATGKELADRNASEGIEPRNIRIGEADSFHMLEGSRIRRVMVSGGFLVRGLRPWYADESRLHELGRPACFPEEADKA